MENCIFCKIINGDFNTNFIYEDEKLVAFNDINPQAPTHILFVPKEHIVSLNELTDTTIVKDIYEAIKKVDEEDEKFHKLLHTIFYICKLAGFEIEGRIVLTDIETGRIWR